jgi:hypothetical protein
LRPDDTLISAILPFAEELIKLVLMMAEVTFKDAFTSLETLTNAALRLDDTLTRVPSETLPAAIKLFKFAETLTRAVFRLPDELKRFVFIVADAAATVEFRFAETLVSEILRFPEALTKFTLIEPDVAITAILRFEDTLVRFVLSLAE